MCGRLIADHFVGVNHLGRWQMASAVLVIVEPQYGIVIREPAFGACFPD
jgi:hypothetical protein